MADDLAIEVEIGGSATAALVASDPDGDPLTWSITEPPALGEVVDFEPATGVFTYQTDRLTSGSDSFAFTVTDGSNAASGTVTVAIVPFVFTGNWALGAVSNNGASCSGGTFGIAHATSHLDVGQRTITCGSTTYRFDAVYARLEGTTVIFNGEEVGEVDDASLSMTRSASVSGCGTVTTTLTLSKTASGYSYAETASVPCGPDPNMQAAPTYTPIARVEFAPETHSFGSVAVDQTASRAVQMTNIGKVPATSLGAVSADPAFAFAGGAYPGTGGTCGDALAGRASCTVTMTGESESAGIFASYLTTSYQDGATGRTAYGYLRLHVLPALTGPTAVAIEGNAACALASTGVVCWGNDESGRLEVPALESPVAVDVGGSLACAADATGAVCWGAAASTPPALDSPTAISAGAAHACALHEGGVSCWGDNSRGQSTVPTLTNPIAVSAGGYHSCAIDDTGVHCWGWNNIGQTSVPPLSNPTAVSAGAWHTCAIDDGGVRCWGRNYDGESTVPALTAPTMVSAAQYRTCAADATGLHCWGTDDGGVGFEPAVSAPTSLSADWGNACVIDGGAVRCW